MKKVFNAANIITFTRIFLLFVLVFMLYGEGPYLKISALILLLLVIWMDWLDGVVARKWGLTTKLGAVLDIAGDRIVENTLLIVFADLDLIPIWVPIVFISRGFLANAIRGMALAKGQTSFAMMRSKLGRLLVASRFGRGSYLSSKGSLFTLAVVVHILKTELSLSDIGWLENLLFVIVLITVAYNLSRFVLLAYDSRKLLSD
jgi:CDP-diacylglycerol--glycerol-3-phosphate 3-phosphatidyltransferase